MCSSCTLQGVLFDTPLPVIFQKKPQDQVMQEAKIMRQMQHPKILPLLCSFVHGQHLWMITPYLSAGSMLSVMEDAYPEVRCLSI
jgi:serine/threonine protein kinase